MIAVMFKRMDDIGVEDVEARVESTVREGREIEFKEGLSTGGRSVDSWSQGAQSIGDRARNVLLKEATGFANAFGGLPMLGVAESATKPAVADRLCPVPRCVDLAERLTLALRDCVEPQIPRIEVVAVPIEVTKASSLFESGSPVSRRTGSGRRACVLDEGRIARRS